jgi:hypothetical protein
MDALAGAVLALALRFAPPGRSPHSLVPMPECGTNPLESRCAGVSLCDEPRLECRSPKWSRYHNAWVRIESAAMAARRYRVITHELERTAHELLGCSDPTSNCEPLGWTRSERELILATLTVALHESGLRRDIERGEAPLGRGPNREACLLQIDVQQAPRFAGWVPPPDRDAISNSPQARERFAQTLLGEDPAALSRCFEIGMRMLAKAARSCSSSPSPDHGMFSMYGSGTTCNAPALANRARTLARLRSARDELSDEDRALLAKAGE